MKKKCSKLLAVLLLLVMVVSSTVACGGSKSASGSVKRDKDHVFKERAVKYDLGDHYSNTVVVAGDRIYFQYAEYPQHIWEGDEDDSILYDDAEPRDTENGVMETYPVDDELDVVEPYPGDPNGEDYIITQHFVSFKLDGSDRRDITKEFHENDGWIYNTAVDDNGNYYYITDLYNSYYDDMGYYVDEETFTLYSMDANGNDRWNLDITDLFKKMSQDPNAYFYLNNIVPVGDKLVVLSSFGLLVLDDKGQVLNQNSDLGEIGGCYKGKDGKIIITKWGDGSAEYYTYDVTTNKLSDKLSVPKMADNMSCWSGKYYDLYFSNSTELYGYNFGDSDLTEIMDYIDSDISAGYLNKIMALDERSFLVSYYDEETNNSAYAVMEKVDPADVKDQEVITLACGYLDYRVRKQVVTFNKTNPNYRISIKDYSIYDTYENDTYTSGTTRLNSDIIAGNIPDILVGNADLPLAIYQSKGLLTDLYKLMDEDPEIRREDYLQNIFRAYEYEGKLTSIPTSFTIITAVAKTKLVGDRDRWTIADMQQVLSGMDPEAQAFRDMTRDEFLERCMIFSGNTLVDWESGKCYFDTKEFVDLLKYCKTLPKEINWDEKYENENYWMAMEGQYRNELTLLEYMYLNNFRSFEYTEQGEFGERISFIGFPSGNGKGSVIQSDYTFSIANKCKNKQGAWEFVRYFLTPEFQNGEPYSFPILRSAFDPLIEEAKDRPHWVDENGNKEYYDDYYWMGDVQVPINPSTDESINRIMSLIESVDQIYSYDENWMNIVKEEAASYFEGNKAPEDVAKVIQSRVNIYVNETK